MTDADKDMGKDAGGDADLQDRLIEAALTHIPFDGWSQSALRAGARDLGVPEDVARDIFPGGTRDMIRHFSRWADRCMIAGLDAADLDERRIHERVTIAVELRLEALEAHKEAVRRGLSWLAMPQNAILGARLLYRTVNDIWYAVGDRSADFSFYTKRGLLAGVVGSTTLFWLDDNSEGGVETSAFLDRRIADVMRIHSARRRTEAVKMKAPNPLRILRDVARKRYGAKPYGPGRTMGDSRLT
ncbi:MAG: ubiquinone biosynthesis protein COQ9 [Paracoccaceae bacterium]|jgi:ubiquinone biosynthesis protein COQ9